MVSLENLVHLGEMAFWDRKGRKGRQVSTTINETGYFIKKVS